MTIDQGFKKQEMEPWQESSNHGRKAVTKNSASETRLSPPCAVRDRWPSDKEEMCNEKGHLYLTAPHNGFRTLESYRKGGGIFSTRNVLRSGK